VINVPEWGYETDEGISLDFAWPKEKIAVLLEPDGDDAAELEDSGWTLVSATVDTVTSALGYSDVRSSSLRHQTMAMATADSRRNRGPGRHRLDEHHDAQERVQDGEVHQGRRLMDFLIKLGARRDGSPGLHIEPIRNSADRRFRTGRVDKFWRAVLFKLTGKTGTSWVIYGVYPHDDAIKLAASLKLDVNPTNGVTEITLVDKVDSDELEARLAAASTENELKGKHLVIARRSTNSSRTMRPRGLTIPTSAPSRQAIRVMKGPRFQRPSCAHLLIRSSLTDR
jgi:hypothetical protein